MQSNNDIIKQANAFAMRNGIVLGIFGILSLYVFKLSFWYPFFSTLFGVMLLGSPVLGAFLTFKYRKLTIRPQEGFSFFHGFLHSLLMGLYASIWIALAIFIYLKYFDHGAIFAAYEQSLSTPQMTQQLYNSGLMSTLNEITNGHGVKGIGETMKHLGAAPYASMAIYSSLIFGPVISVIIGLLAMKSRP